MPDSHHRTGGHQTTCFLLISSKGRLRESIIRGWLDRNSGWVLPTEWAQTTSQVQSHARGMEFNPLRVSYICGLSRRWLSSINMITVSRHKHSFFPYHKRLKGQRPSLLHPQPTASIWGQVQNFLLRFEVLNGPPTQLPRLHRQLQHLILLSLNQSGAQALEERWCFHVCRAEKNKFQLQKQRAILWTSLSQWWNLSFAQD